MSNERPNEFLPWRAQLSKPDALPEQGLEDREQSWQRLAERLHKKPRRPGIAWWIAAACLILVFFLPATQLFRNRPVRPNRVAIRQPAQRQPVTSLHGQPDTHIQRQPAMPQQHSSAMSAQYLSAPSTQHPPAPLTQRQPSPAPMHDTILPIPSVAPNVAVVALPNTALRLAATPAAHQPLRIVYLNELGKDPGPSEDLDSRQPTFLRLSTAADWSTAQHNTSTIRIDIFPHNH